MQKGQFLTNQCKTLLDNKKNAILWATILSVIPFASWLSVALVCLVTLRKGAKPGSEVLVPAMVIHSVPLLMLFSLKTVLVNVLIGYFPSYLAAITLRKTAKWQYACGALFIQCLIGFGLIQLLAPGFVASQFNHFKQILSQFQEYQQVIEYSTEGLSLASLAQLFFGIQILSVIISLMISLIVARSIQSRLFMPGGFNQEMLEFRGGRLAFLLLIAVGIGAYFQVPVATNLLPLTLAYFFLSGFCLAYYILAKKWQFRVLILLSLLLILKPFSVAFALVVIGSIDSLFNIRLYLPARASEST
ncbi:hypothetical protein [Legionella waltersii]|uniref:Membrane protein n=1 Tax=Legionella waltersii TaxID=66969 RepID=A0A0W1A105_9GAMM|nr:hypothetical protein [Legionella waltersii]KTD75012.1 membrane protein [Legionella waltersii]SNV05562.1 membrane protein [Legionella waltersii]